LIHILHTGKKPLVYQESDVIQLHVNIIYCFLFASLLLDVVYICMYTYSYAYIIYNCIILGQIIIQFYCWCSIQKYLLTFNIHYRLLSLSLLSQKLTKLYPCCKNLHHMWCICFSQTVKLAHDFLYFILFIINSLIYGQWKSLPDFCMRK